MAGSAKRKALVSVALVVLVLTIGAVQSTAQSFPSQEQAPMKQGLLRVPEILGFLENASAYSHEIMHNVTAANFTNAAANAAAYRKIADNFSAWQKNAELDYAVVHDVSTSSDLFGQLVVKAERYNVVYKGQLSNGTNDPHSDQSTNNALELKTLSSEIQALSDQLNATNDRISGTAMSQGTDLSDATVEQAFDNYVAALNIRTQNVTDLVFRNTTTSLRATPLSADMRALRFGDLVDLSGNVSDGNVNVSDASVHLSVGGKPITVLSTNAAGHYNYTYSIADVPAGNQTFAAMFYPQDTPYKKSEGSATLAVSNVSAQNTLRLSSGSPLTKLSFEGVITADGKPVKNATVDLYAGDKFAGAAITDENGAYEMTYGMDRFNVLASLLQSSSVTFRATLTPGTYPLEGISSNVVSVPLLGGAVAANPVPTAAGALVAIAVVVLLVFRTYGRRSKKAATAAVESTAPTTDVLRPLVGAGVEAPAEDTSRARAEALENVDALVNRARALSSEGAENQAVIALYEGAISLAAGLSGLVFEPGKTHRERLALIEQSKPVLGEPLRALTFLFELARYSNRTLSPNHVDAAIDALIVLSGLGSKPETEGE